MTYLEQDNCELRDVEGVAVLLSGLSIQNYFITIVDILKLRTKKDQQFAKKVVWLCYFLTTLVFDSIYIFW